MVERGRLAVLEHFRWIDGHADTWAVLRRPDSLRAVVDGLAHLLTDDRPDVVVAVEARGFVLGPAVALALGVGFVPVRKDGAVFPGPVVTATTEPDYRGNRRTLALRQDLIGPGERVVLVDDWIETGSQARAAAGLVERCGGTLVAVDEAAEAARSVLPPVRSLVRAQEL
ncbi:phosphoribosyltransferase family protein [Curtobacterium oceanosedimentum]|uniref:phosphoribosyltransferase family protein n=1 Tax=Curtobacterium oceanosedimentum TaxID=465820 RepID=UPI001CE05C97|nr:phosphoribosyltransferase family protein [Curtobacterium oceanosedimentum]MCA5923518.1 adenine phosphoribosyltransferase [Curtobacterium oceanosedimentum]